MINVFNTVFEVSLRILMILESMPRDWLSAERIAAFDFIGTYGKDFGISDYNLHGDNNYRYSEFALRRELVREALKLLTAKSLVDVTASQTGFAYALSPLGSEYCIDLECGYSDEYREMAESVREFGKRNGGL